MKKQNDETKEKDNKIINYVWSIFVSVIASTITTLAATGQLWKLLQKLL